MQMEMQGVVLLILTNGHDATYRKVGTRRKVLAKDILNYKSMIDAERVKTLDELAKQSQDLDLGYE